MRFFQGFFALLALAVGMIFAAFNFVAQELAHIAMLFGAGVIIAIDIFAFLVWFVNWRYYPES